MNRADCDSCEAGAEREFARYEREVAALRARLAEAERERDEARAEVATARREGEAAMREAVLTLLRAQSCLPPAPGIWMHLADAVARLLPPLPLKETHE